MKLSIIVPVYNTGNYLKKCLNSLVNQTLDDIEIIIVNDGSTDNSEEIIKKYELDYKDKIVFINKKNGGQGSARNIGVKRATGDYIGFVDSDDFVDKNMFKDMYEEAIKKGSDIVICGISNYYEKNKLTSEVHLNLQRDTSVKEAFIKSVPSVVNKIYKRNLIISNEILFDENIWYEDFPYSMQLIVNANKINYIDKCYYYYFHRLRSTMHNENIEKNLDILKAFDILVQYLKEINKYKEYEDEINFLVLKEIYIATINRILRTSNKRKDKNIVIKKIKEYTCNFSLKNNKYFKTLTFNYKLSYYLIKLKMYFMINLLFKLKEIKK